MTRLSRDRWSPIPDQQVETLRRVLVNMGQREHGLVAQSYIARQLNYSLKEVQILVLRAGIDMAGPDAKLTTKQVDRLFEAESDLRAEAQQVADVNGLATKRHREKYYVSPEWNRTRFSLLGLPGWLFILFPLLAILFILLSLILDHSSGKFFLSQPLLTNAIGGVFAMPVVALLTLVFVDYQRRRLDRLQSQPRRVALLQRYLQLTLTLEWKLLGELETISADAEAWFILKQLLIVDPNCNVIEYCNTSMDSAYENRNLVKVLPPSSRLQIKDLRWAFLEILDTLGQVEQEQRDPELRRILSDCRNWLEVEGFVYTEEDDQPAIFIPDIADRLNSVLKAVRHSFNDDITMASRSWPVLKWRVHEIAPPDQR